MKKKKEIKKKILSVVLAAALLGGGCFAGIAIGSGNGIAALFTDREHIDSNANIGTLNMTLTDMTNLDSNYRTWTNRITSSSNLTNNGLQSDDWDVPYAADLSATSAGIINPGDTGILAFKIKC